MRIVAFGCSFTYGVGLEDCFIPPDNPGILPSNFSWPQLVANMLNVECINKAEPGASNKQILNTILQSDSESEINNNDFVIIMWTFPNRWCVINEFNQYTKISESDTKNIKELELYHKLLPDFDLTIDLFYRANFAKLFLDKKGIFNYHLSVAPNRFTNRNVIPKFVENWNLVNFSKINLSLSRANFPPALDTKHGNPHPGPLAHEFTANLIYREISNAHNK